MPLIAQVTSGLQSELLIFGNVYSTQDGTGVRGCIHEQDLA
jgi:UDP-glucose 4-epimerase